MMASNYYYGDGVKQDYALAIMYANFAMVQGYPKSWRRWGEFYQDGLAVKKDYRKAREFYEKGAQIGDYNCYNKVGDMFYYGWGFQWIIGKRLSIISKVRKHRNKDKNLGDGKRSRPWDVVLN